LLHDTWSSRGTSIWNILISSLWWLLIKQKIWHDLVSYGLWPLQAGCGHAQVLLLLLIEINTMT
jgi:hypothetical protein